MNTYRTQKLQNMSTNLGRERKGERIHMQSINFIIIVDRAKR